MSAVILDTEDTHKRVAAAAAAAAARKKRRKAMARSRSKSPQKSRLARAISLISPTVTGIQEVARRWKEGHTIAIPTECTYEVGMRLSISDSDELHSEVERCLRGVLKLDGPYPTPHLYISGFQSSSAATNFLKQHLPERKYAFRKEGKVVSLCSFSESMQVLKRVATRIWPGPVILHVAMGGRASTTGSTSTDSASVSDEHPSPSPSPPSPSPPASPLLIRRSSSHFLALRCPCHPLAVKVAQEYYKDSQDLLVGLALPRTQRSSNSDTWSLTASSSFITSANDIHSGPMAVLHGEENLEIFCVPPCEYQQPYGVTVWIEEGRRRITLRGRPSNDSAAPLRPAQVSLSSIAQSLHFKPKTEKDRVIQAVLSKWVVDEEE